MFPFFAEILMLVMALCVDAFAACFAYGAQKVKIPFQSAAVFSGISAGVLLLFLLAGGTIGLVLPEAATRSIGFCILFLLGIVKLFDGAIKAVLRRFPSLERKISFSVSGLHFILNVYADPQEANGEDLLVLSPKEAVTLGIALSLDSAAAGIGAGIVSRHLLLTAALAFGTGLLAAWSGTFLGERLADRCRLELSWAGGVLLLLLAFSKLF